MFNSTFGQFVALNLARNQTCKNFAELAKRGYYNGVVFHRVIAVCHASARWRDEELTLLSRTSWHRQVILLAPEEAGPAYMGNDCEWRACCRCIHRYSCTIAAKMSFTQSYGSRVQGSWQWPTPVPIPTVRLFSPSRRVPSKNSQVPNSSSPLLRRHSLTTSTQYLGGCSPE